MDNQTLYDLKNSFLAEWPISRIKEMSIEEYTNLNKTSFCYWVENKTNDLGGIRGGSSYKFGVYLMKKKSKTKPAQNRNNDDKYAWHTKYGKTSIEAFNDIKKIIVQIAKLSNENNLEAIDEIDLGDAFKWKIAFLYSDFRIINIFKHSVLKRITEHLGYENSGDRYSELNKFILSKMEDQDFFKYTKDLWKVLDNSKENRERFEQWMKNQESYSTGKKIQYLKAINILEDKFEIEVYEESEKSELEDLYQDLIDNQRDVSGKYYYEKAKSYGTKGFFSAAIKTYIKFFDESVIKYWIFQGNPKIFDFKTALRNDLLTDWTVSSHKKSIKVGDKVIIWITGSKSGCYSIAEVTSAVHKRTPSPDDHLWKEKNSSESKANIKILHNLVDSPILKDALKDIKDLANFNAGNQGTNFSANKKQFDILLNMINKKPLKKTPLNQILFGPPGTGKTYNTINEAIKITDPEFYEYHKDDRDKLKERFKLLLMKNDDKSKGQIGFTTFHQSFSYEDFIEGIKPVEPKESDKYLKYEIQEGIFKEMCDMAQDSLNAAAVNSDSLISLNIEDFEKADFYKMSLGNTRDENDNEIYDYCIENNYVTIGFGEQLDFTGKDETQLRTFGKENNLEAFPIQAMNLFSNFLKIGNYVVISFGNKYVRAIGRIIGDYEFIEDSKLPNNLHYKHFRKVQWIFTDKKIPAGEIYNKNLSQQTIYKLGKNEIKQDFFVNEKKIDPLDLPKNPKNFVLIIDEINRGNVSSIFGELITLIEKNKRAGADEELSVILPYSKREFKVPQNLHLIGTMNTADRSIEALDTALRRRFSFKEMPPKSSLIATHGKLKKSDGKIGDIDVVKILETINNRIDKLIDKDHKIGHSYFLNISNVSQLEIVFNDKVIPLLEEYFFGDYGKISLILGSSFISSKNKSDVKFASSNDYDPSIASDLLERSVYEITSKSQWDFKAIYE